MNFKVFPLALGLILAGGCSNGVNNKDLPDHQTAEIAADSAKKMCPEHNVLLAECGICKPQGLAQVKVGESMKVRLPASDSASIAGVETAQPTIGASSDGVESYAELAFNQNKLAHIAAPVGGIIQEVTADVGTKVEEKQVVARLWSASIAEAVAKAVLNHQTLERERKLRKERIISEKDLQQVEAEHRAACQQLRTFGFTEDQIDELGTKPQDQVLMDIRAPFKGELVERAAVRGALVEPGATLFTLADRSVMWAMLNIPEAFLANIKEGQSVELRVEALPEKVFTGRLTWVGAEVDERTRMARARAEVPNPDGFLRAKMFAQARVLTQTTDGAMLLPVGAIQQIEGKPFVFVKKSDDLFEARVVRVGATSDGRVEILEGIKPEEAVAINHVFPIKSALLISRLGAGCADD